MASVFSRDSESRLQSDTAYEIKFSFWITVAHANQSTQTSFLRTRKTNQSPREGVSVDAIVYCVMCFALLFFSQVQLGLFLLLNGGLFRLIFSEYAIL